MNSANQSAHLAAAPASVLDTRVVFLTHYIPLYQVRVLQEMTAAVREFKILLSTPIEPNRDFRPDWSGLDVEVQKTMTFRRRWRHRAAGFNDPLFVHVPYDTTSRLRALAPDVVVSHELGARSFAAASYCRRTGTKLVLATFMSEHTEQGRGWLRRRLREHLVSRADAITYNGPSCRRYLLSLGAHPEQLFHLPYAADDRNLPTEITPHDEPKVRRSLLCIGQLSQRKGILPLIEQLGEFCRISGEPLELTLVGDGPLRSSVQALADDLAAAPDSRLKINVLGNRPAAELPGLMQQHGVLIAPTLADEWLLVVNEAMHAALPVIGSIYAQSVTTMIQPDLNGWHYNPLHPSPEQSDSPSYSLPDAPPLADILREYLAASDEQIAAMRRRAITSASEYTPQRSAVGAVEAIRSVLNPGTTSSKVDDETCQGCRE